MARRRERRGFQVRLATTVFVMALVFAEPARTESYSYDAAGRLTGVTYDDGSSIAYTYDANGNLLTIEKTAANSAPACADVSIVTDANTAGSVNPDCADADGDTLTYVIVGQPANGTAGVAGGVLNYSPDQDFVGDDSFTYRANDGADDSNIATVGVTVNPIAVPVPDLNVAPASFDFGSIAVGNASNQDFTISNNGTADLVVASVTLVGSDAAEFSVAAGTCPDLAPTLAVAASCTVTVTMSPASPGGRTADLRISSNDPDTPTFDAALSGTGTDQLVADAGADQTVDEFDEVALDASGSSRAAGPIASYAWAQLSGAAVTLSDTAAVAPTFTAPGVDAAGDVLVFELTVSDGMGGTATDTVGVTVADSVTPAPAAPGLAGGNTDPIDVPVTAGSDGVILMRFEIDLAFASELASLSLQATGSGDAAVNVSSVEVYEDVNRDDALDAGDVLVGEGRYGADGTLDLALNPAYAVGAGRRVFLIVYDFAG